MQLEEKAIVAEIFIPADIRQVWTAWTTETGAMTFFAPFCKIDFIPGGAYEMYFDLDAPVGLRGGEGCKILAIQPMTLLSFTWNAPPSLARVRNQFTHVIVRLFEEIRGTRIKLHHDGWGTGDEWDKAFYYFEVAWKRVVMPRLLYRFSNGPINWHNPPDLSDYLSSI